MIYYNSMARGYNELYGHEQSEKINIIKNNIKVNANTKMLDVGCGTGISSKFSCLVVGIDPGIELLKQSNRLKILAVAEYLPFKDRSFDYVISVTSIHNFKNIRKSINEIKRVGTKNFVFSILRKSKKYDYIKKLVQKDFRIYERAILVPRQQSQRHHCRRTGDYRQ